MVVNLPNDQLSADYEIQKQKKGKEGETIVTDISSITAEPDTDVVKYENSVNKKITSWIKDKGFGRVKFLGSKEMYDCDSQFYKKVMLECYTGFALLSKEEKDALWNDYGRKAKNRLNNRRHNVVKAMKDKYLCKCASNKEVRTLEMHL